MAYNLGAIWLQVIPSFDGVQDAGRQTAKDFHKAYEDQLNKQERASETRRKEQAKKRGEAVGNAEAEGRTKAERAAEARAAVEREKAQRAEQAAQRRHQEKLAQEHAKGEEVRETIRAKHRAEQKAKDADFWREQQAENDAHQRRLAEIERKAAEARKTNAEKSAAERDAAHRRHLDEIEKENVRHVNRLAEIEEKADNDAIRRREQLNNKLAELDQRGQNDIAKIREKARLARERADLVAERRQQENLNRLRQTLIKRAVTDPEGFQAKMNERINAALRDIDAEIDLDLNTTEAEAELKRIQLALMKLRDARIGVDIDAASAITELMAISSALSALDGRDVDVRVDVDIAAALAQLAAIEGATAAVDRNMRQLSSSTDSAGFSASGSANAFRAMNGYLLAAATIGPLAVPAILSVASALAAVATSGIAAVAAIGAGVLAFSGIGDALGAMSDLESEQQYGNTPRQQRQTARRQRSADRAVRDADRGVVDARRAAEERLAAAIERSEDAARGVVDAERALARAREDAVDRVADAIERQRDAERNLERVQRDARRTQERLTEARRQARREIEDLNNALISGTLSEQDALYDLEEARYALFRIQQDGSATEREKARAQLAYDIQVQQYKELQLQNERLAEDQAEASEKGVEGSDQVVDARQAQLDMEERLADAQRQVERATRDRARAEVDAVRMVEDAERRLADAREAQADAQRGIEDARIEGARAVERAEERLADALEGQRDAALEAAEGTAAMTTATRKLQEALDNLSPTGRDFAIWLFSLKPLLDDLRWAAQEGFLPGLQQGMQTAIDVYFPRVLDFVERFSTAMGRHAITFGEWLTEPEIVQFFDLLGEYALIFLDQFAIIAPAFTEGLMGIITALLPFTEQFGDALIWMGQAFAEWANSEEGQAAMAAFLGYIASISPELWNLFSLTIQVVAKALIGLTPYIDELLDFFIGIMTWLNEQDPETLGRWARNLILVVAGFQLLAGSIGFLSTTVGLFGSLRWIVGLFGGFIDGAKRLASFLGIGAGARAAGGIAAGAAGRGGIRAALGGISKAGWIGMAVAALILGILWLYDNFEPFADFVNGIGARIAEIWENHIYPAIEGFWVWLRDEFWPGVQNVLTVLGDWFTWLYENVILPVWDNIKLAFDIGRAFIEVAIGLIQVAFDVMGIAWRLLYDNVIKPVWEAYIRPVFEAVGSFIDEHVAPRFASAIGYLGELWNGLRQLFSVPIVWVVDTVINGGIIETLNKVFDFFDIDTVRPVRVPQGLRDAANGIFNAQPPLPRGNRAGTGGRTTVGAFAEGGILPGYTPGQDVHEFFSPTAGRLLLSGGEAILRPEVTRALGEDTIHALNAAAIRGELGTHRYALGGLVDWLGDVGSSIWSGVTRGARWIGDIAQYAWDFITDPVASLQKVVDWLMNQATEFSEETTIGRLAVGGARGLIDKIGGALGDMLGFSDPSASGAPAFQDSTPPGSYIRGAKPFTNWAAWNAANAVGGVRLMQALTRSMVGDHKYGTAVDFFDDRDTLNRLASYIVAHADRLRLRYLAWNGREYMPAIGWRPQPRNYGGGDPWHRWHVHMSVLPTAGRYADGGVVPDNVLLRDDGGWLPHGAMALNLSGRDEYTMSPEETEMLKNILAGRADAAGVDLDINVNQPGATAGEIADEMLWALRRARRGGAYAGV